jgi:hypothetical protein
MKFYNNDEYDGQWSLGRKDGKGVFMEASIGRVERR